MSIAEDVLAIALEAKAASAELAVSSTQTRNDALKAMAAALRAQAGVIVAENALDVQAAREGGTKESLVDRLFLDEQRVFDMADALEDLV